MRKWSRPLGTSVTMCSLHPLPLSRKWQVARHFVRGETKDEEDNEFIRWVHRTHRLSSMYALRASVSVADRPITQSHALCFATTVAAGAGPTVTNNPSVDTTSGGKRPRSRDDTGHDVQKHPRRMGSLAEGESHTPMSSPTLGTHATLPNIGIGHDDDVVSGVSPHGTGGSLDHRAASVESVYLKRSMGRYFSS
uniref:Uncharacterized protein n=1 Tax=Hyaloperonospora arabidopsidis (strain Emoy2) TaxID=559515 RepID=M4BQ56_HYAAE